MEMLHKNLMRQGWTVRCISNNSVKKNSYEIEFSCRESESAGGCIIAYNQLQRAFQKQEQCFFFLLGGLFTVYLCIFVSKQSECDTGG